MSLIIRKKLFNSNALTVLLGTVTLSAIFGTILYHTVGWQRSSILSAALFIISAIITILLASEATNQPKNRSRNFWFINAIIFAETLACFWYAFHHTANDWVGSPWQVVSYKFILTLFSSLHRLHLPSSTKKFQAAFFSSSHFSFFQLTP